MPEVYTTTGDNIAADVRAKFGDEAGVQLDDVDILRWINNGARRIASGAPWIQKTSSTALLAGVDAYDLSVIQRDLISIATLTVQGQSVPIIGWQDFLNRTAGVNDPNDLTLPDGPFATLYGNTLTLRPVPTDTVADGITLYYTSLPAQVIALSAVLPVPDRLCNALNDYVLQQALELDERFEESEVKRTHTEAAIREALTDDQSPTGYYQGITQVGADVW